MKRLFNRYRYKSFRKGVLFKKGYIKKTWIKRNQFAFFKHLLNWAIYVQIWQNWVKNFQWFFYIAKFQYFKNFNEFEIISYNSYFFNNKKLKLISNYDHFVNCYLSRKLFFYFINKNFKSFSLSFLGFFSYSFSFLKDNELPLFPSSESSIFPISYFLENNYYSINMTDDFPIFDLNLIFKIILKLIIHQITEMRKIVTLLYLPFFHI